jgi:predicted Zn-dependent protease with MMP-like domain
MNLTRLQQAAEAEVCRVISGLPDELRAAAETCPVRIFRRPTPEQERELGDDLLGLFEGCSRLEPRPDGPMDLPCITLFLENLWDEADEDEAQFVEEVRITLLHELGHYLGWDENQVEQMGLS